MPDPWGPDFFLGSTYPGGSWTALSEPIRPAGPVDNLNGRHPCRLACVLVRSSRSGASYLACIAFAAVLMIKNTHAGRRPSWRLSVAALARLYYNIFVEWCAAFLCFPRNPLPAVPLVAFLSFLSLSDPPDDRHEKREEAGRREGIQHRPPSESNKGIPGRMGTYKALCKAGPQGFGTSRKIIETV